MEMKRDWNRNGDEAYKINEKGDSAIDPYDGMY